MSMPNQEGTFTADVIDRVFTEQGDNALPCVILRFALVAELSNGELEDVTEEQLEITNYSYLQKKDGMVNEYAVKSLKEAFEWDGLDPFWFEDSPALPRVQLVLKYETYNGQERLRVQFINKLGSTGGGGMPQRDPSLRNSMKGFMRDLRTFSGGTARKPASAPVAAPKAPPARPSAPPAPPSAPESTAEEVWEYFANGCEKAGITDIENKWWELIQNTTGKNDPGAITGEEWSKIKAAAKTTLLVSGEDIPF